MTAANSVLDLGQKTYVRKPIYTDAVEVTPENIDLVALWIEGKVMSSKGEKVTTWIEVPVRNPLNSRQTKAYVGDFVLKNKNGAKVYTPKAFAATWSPKELV